MRGVLFIVILVRDIESVPELQLDALKFLCVIFENSSTVHDDNQGVTALAAAP